MPGAQLSATASETKSIFSQRVKVGAELKMINTVILQCARDSLPNKMDKRAFIQIGSKILSYPLLYQYHFLLKPANLHGEAT